MTYRRKTWKSFEVSKYKSSGLVEFGASVWGDCVSAGIEIQFWKWEFQFMKVRRG